jgi:hypothetical protein
MPCGAVIEQMAANVIRAVIAVGWLFPQPLLRLVAAQVHSFHLRRIDMAFGKRLLRVFEEVIQRHTPLDRRGA